MADWYPGLGTTISPLGCIVGQLLWKPAQVPQLRIELLTGSQLAEIDNPSLEYWSQFVDPFPFCPEPFTLLFERNRPPEQLDLLAPSSVDLASSSTGDAAAQHMNNENAFLNVTQALHSPTKGNVGESS